MPSRSLSKLIWGGALIGWAGPATAFGFATALSVCALAFLAGLKEPHRPAAPPRRLRGEIRDGARFFVFRQPLLRPIFATTFVFNIAMFVLLSAFVPYAVRSLGLSSQAVGAVLGHLGSLASGLAERFQQRGENLRHRAGFDE